MQLIQGGIQKNIQGFILKEESVYCFHIALLDQLVHFTGSEKC